MSSRQTWLNNVLVVVPAVDTGFPDAFVCFQALVAQIMVLTYWCCAPASQHDVDNSLGGVAMWWTNILGHIHRPFSWLQLGFGNYVMADARKECRKKKLKVCGNMRKYAANKCDVVEDKSSGWLDPGIAILAKRMQHIVLLGFDDSTDDQHFP